MSNRRMLIIDEEFRKILMLSEDSHLLDQARAVLFGEAPALLSRVDYEFDFANQAGGIRSDLES